jgi:hypothetical protein
MAVHLETNISLIYNGTHTDQPDAPDVLSPFKLPRLPMLKTMKSKN